MILLTMLAQNRPKSKRQCLNRAIFYFKIKQGEVKQLGYVSDQVAGVNIESNFALKEKKVYHSHYIKLY